MWHSVAGRVVRDILEDYRAFILRVKLSKKKMKALQFFEILMVVWHLKWLESSATQLWESPILQVIFVKFIAVTHDTSTYLIPKGTAM